MIGLPLMKNVLKALVKSVLIPLKLTDTASAADAGIHKKLLQRNRRNEEIEEIIKTVKSLEDSSLLIRYIIQTIEYETKGQRSGFFGMLLGKVKYVIGGKLLGCMLEGKGVILIKVTSRRGQGVI